MADDKNVGGLLIAFLAGSVVGAAAALLFAPSSGTETRQRIRAASTEAKDKTLEKVGTVKSEATHLVERGKERVTGVKSQIQSAVEAGKEAYKGKKTELAEEEE